MVLGTGAQRQGHPAPWQGAQPQHGADMGSGLSREGEPQGPQTTPTRTWSQTSPAKGQRLATSPLCRPHALRGNHALGRGWGAARRLADTWIYKCALWLQFLRYLKS